MVVQLLTRGQGRHAGLVRGGQGARARGIYQPGNLVVRARAGAGIRLLAEHLGRAISASWRPRMARATEPRGCSSGTIRRAWRALSAAAAVSEGALPEREPHAACYEGFLALLDALDGDHWAEVYVRWELALLAELGFGLDLSACAGQAKGQRQLAYVSPKSGRAVSLAVGEPYRDRLFPRCPGSSPGAAAAGRIIGRWARDWR